MAENVKFHWKDKKRIFGIPMSFTKYSLSDDRLFIETGLFNLTEDEILLYRIRDIALSRSFGQRIFGVGTIKIMSNDKSSPLAELKSIKDPKTVKELIHNKVEEAKGKAKMRTTEIMGDYSDIDGDVE